MERESGGENGGALGGEGEEQQSVLVSDSVVQGLARRKTTGQAIQTGEPNESLGCPSAIERGQSSKRTRLDWGWYGACAACLLHSIAPAKIDGERLSSHRQVRE